MKPDSYDKTIIVWDGKSYFLQATPLGYSGHICDYCDLKDLCMGKGEEFKFSDLCSPDDGEAPYRFVEDWQYVDKPFIEVIESQVEYVSPPSESRLIQSEEKE